MRISSPLIRVTLDELRIKFGTRDTEFLPLEPIFPLRTEVADILEALELERLVVFDDPLLELEYALLLG